MDTLQHAPSDSVPLESVLCTEELSRRPRRPPDYETENRALAALVQALADSPHTILQTLADKILEVFRADSAGVSLLTTHDGGQRFHWPAIAGVWRPHIGGGTPRNFGPCGDVLDRNAPLMFRHFERRYTYFLPVTPPVEECLLVPFFVEGKAVGTIWAITHDERRKFDAEDMRQLVSLGTFASSAYQAVAAANQLRQQATDLSEADHRKDEFLAMLAHELRNPLAPIRNALRIMQLTPGNAEAIEAAFQMMDRQSSHMVRLVDDLLDVSRISRGKINLRKARVALASVVNEAVEVARAHCESLELNLAVSLPPEPIYLEGDSTRLAQIVGNLLSNACKFTDRGGSIRLSVEREAGQAVIRVRDTGIGIGAEQLPRIFELFVQADTSLERPMGGLGIGLTLVKNLVELHGGGIEVKSAGVGHGSEFVVRLPALTGTARPPAPEPAGPEPAPTTGLRILVVDDNRDMATSLAMVLELTGNETHIANDGLEAVDKAADVRPDVILLDIGLPKLNGYEVARKIRTQPWGKAVVMVAITGWGQEEDRQKAADAGFDAHLVKPMEHHSLTRLLAELPTRKRGPSRAPQSPRP